MRYSLRQLCVGAAAALLTATALPLTAFAASGDVTVQQSNETDKHELTIGNDQISRTFSWDNDKLKTTEIDNKRAGTKFTPADGSEEFIVKMTKNSGDQKLPTAIDRSQWKVTASTEHTEGEDGRASNVIDGNVSTYWHSKYGTGAGSYTAGHWLQFDLGKSTEFKSFSYTPRQNSETVNGNVATYKLLYSNAETAPAADADWSVAVENGTFTYDGVNPIYVNLDNAVTARWVKFVPLSAKNSQSFAACAEFNLYAEKYTPADLGTDYDFAASELTLAADPTVTDTTATINGHEKTGKQVTFTFQAKTFRSVDFTIKEHVVMYNGDHYMRKFLEISVPETQKDFAIIDYIDLESLKTNSSDTTWTVPTNAGGIVAMDAFKANLGQPIYIQGMFLGCEFPETDTQIVNSTGYMRYYTGKSFDRLQQDNQAGETKDGKITYNTWQTVAGAARSTDASVVQQDFYDYINDIATPSEFRTQYNSWFDNMMFIDDTNILDSFIEVNKQLEAAGADPLGSYVVDDGWNNYNSTVPAAGSDKARRSGTTLNETGFWEFNEKFPNGLSKDSALVQKLGSNFGVWIGPRGGYNYNGELANIMQAKGKGHNAGGSIDVADRNYVSEFSKMAQKWQDDYHVNYWKWDGFADNNQYNAFAEADGVPGYANNHMTGGYKRMYHVTDLWEAWIDLFEQVRANAEKNQIPNLWISLTCYVNPSPWWLQWANSVWLQCVYDQTDAGVGSNKLDKQLNYRDATYYDFIKTHGFQFPLANVYNHDPIYGKEGTGMNKNTATDVQFANYLYTQASRGTAFWELYFSESLMTEGKWQVTAQFLKWAEKNNHLLRNAKMFGSSPNSAITLSGSTTNADNGATYGFSGFDGDEGLIMVRNSSGTAKNITFKFDAATLGAPIEEGAKYAYTLEHVYNPNDNSSDMKDKPSDSTVKTDGTGTFTYGQDVAVNLQASEVITFRVTKADAKDATAPKIASVTTDGDKALTVKFDEFVSGSKINVKAGDKALDVTKVTPSADRVTYKVELKDAPEAGAQLSVTAGDDIKDTAGNAADATAKTVTYRADNKVVASASKEYKAGTTNQLGSSSYSLNNANGFTITLDVKTSSASAVLVQQPGSYTIGINAEGKPYITLNLAAKAKAKAADAAETADVTATAETAVNNGQEHKVTFVKANNGILKVYVDGTLSGSAYNEASETFALTAGTATLGSEGFAGTLAAAVYDTAEGYDEIKAESTEPAVENVAQGKTVGAYWKSDNANAATNTQRPASMAVDGINNTYNNYVDFGADSRTDASYLQVDLGAVYQLQSDENGSLTDVIKMWRYWNGSRTYKGTVIAVAEKADFSDQTIVYNSDTNNEMGLGAGTDSTYAETSAGKSFSLKTATKARYVRVYMHGSGSGNTNHIVELQVFGKQVKEADKTVDTTELRAAIENLKQKLADGNTYTEESKNAADTAIKDAEDLLENSVEITAQQVAAQVEAIKKASDGLVIAEPLPDMAKLKEAAEDLKAKVASGSYQDEGARDAYDVAVAALEWITKNSNATGEQIKAELAKITEADGKLQSLTEPKVEFKGGSLRYSSSDEDLKTEIPGLRLGFHVRVPEKAEVNWDKSGWYYGLNGTVGSVLKPATNHITDTTSKTGGEITNIVFTKIPPAQVNTKLTAKFVLVYTDKDHNEHTKELPIQSRSVTDVAYAIVNSTTATAPEKTYAKKLIDLEETYWSKYY